MRSLDSYIKNSVLYDSNSSRKNIVDKTLAEMVALDSIVEDRGFIKYSKIVDARYKLPSRRHLQSVLMMDLFKETSAKLSTILEEVSSVAVTCDIWSSRANISFFKVTSHFIHEFTLKTASLATRKLLDATNHSAQNIANTLQEVLNSWGLFDKTECIVTDNASSMIEACELLKIRNIPCFAHTLNLVVQDGLNFDDDEKTMAIISKCKAIVKFFKKNTIANEKFKMAQEKFGYSLLQETPTRWNSFFYMIQRILATHDEIAVVLLSTSNAPLPFQAEEIDVLKDLEKILTVFEEVSKRISGGKYATISLIIPLTDVLIRKTHTISSDVHTEVGQKMVTVLLDSIVKRLSPYEKKTATRMATILDPRFKKIGFQHMSNAEQAAHCFENELTASMNKDSSNDTNVEPISTNKDPLFDYIGNKARSMARNTRSDAIIAKRQYLERPLSQQDVDPLLWMKTDFPAIKTLMLKYFCIPATSVQSERVFSKAGQIVSDRRTRLKEENVNILLFLNQNLWLTSSETTE
ncbi:E3 SUMO-protein ligase ZBED1-like isoform X1 [Drosophila willistoni]|uniref:E3 SUMO-protein ligase ZBED1-like isoform X1 n=1 Tax=Drosophila willistoni TaxID=7260 RepID=UPI001F072DB0|nr:E3 SUMO-protein ligase ZBED1-like isoform X1 [Drosophila willistoni]